MSILSSYLFWESVKYPIISIFANPVQSMPIFHDVCNIYFSIMSQYFDQLVTSVDISKNTDKFESSETLYLRFFFFPILRPSFNVDLRKFCSQPVIDSWNNFVFFFNKNNY